MSIGAQFLCEDFEECMASVKKAGEHVKDAVDDAIDDASENGRGGA